MCLPCVGSRPRVKRPVVHLADGEVWLFLTKNKVAIVDEIDADLGQVPWCAVWADGWYAAYVSTTPRRVTHKLHRVVAERAGMTISGLHVDHINGDPLDCRRSNLRPATPAQNARNKGPGATNTSGVRGVNKHSQMDKWHARITTNEGRISLGLYDTKEEAAAVVRDAQKRFHGAFARETSRAR